MIANKEGFIINEYDHSSFEIFSLKGKIIYEYEKRTQKIMGVLERAFNIRMKQIVCDYQRDEKNRVWLVGIHSYLVETNVKIYKPMLKVNGESEEAANNDNKKIFGTKRCKMWRIKYSQDQINKLITTKMMYELKTHLYKRGIFKFDHLEMYKDSIETCKVCNFCYMLVVAEHELIEIEKLYAIAQSIPMDDRSKMISKLSLKNENKISSDNFKNKLQQWRIMFYWKQFFDLKVEELKEACKGNTGNLYLQIRIFDFITPMKLNDFTKTDSISNENDIYEINRMRVHYFFTDTKEVMKSFLTNTEIELRVTEGMNWNKPIAIASSFALQYFKLK